MKGIYIGDFFFLISFSKKDKKQQAEFRRPFGCAVLHLDEPLLSKIGGKEGEFIIPIYSPVDESQFPVLHDCRNSS